MQLKILFMSLLATTFLLSKMANAQEGYILKDINPNGSSSPEGFKAINATTTMFAAFDGNSWGLWKTDGTTTGTELVKAGNNNGVVFNFSLQNSAVLNGKIYFAAEDNSNNAGMELYVSDGTTAGTQLFKDLNPGIDPGNPTSIVATNGKLAFIANEQIWLSNGTASGTTVVDSADGAGILSVGGEYIYYWKDNSIDSTSEIWRTHVLNGTSQMITSDYTPYLADAFKQIGIDMYVIVTELDAASGITFSAVKKILLSGAIQHFCGDVNNNIASALPGIEFGGTIFLNAQTNATGPEVYSSPVGTSSQNLVSEIIPGAAGCIPGNFNLVGNDIYFEVLTDIAFQYNPCIYKYGSVGIQKITAGNPANFSFIFANALNTLFLTEQNAADMLLYALQAGATVATPVPLQNNSSVAGAGAVCNNLVYFNGFIAKDGNNAEPFVIDPAGQTSIAWKGTVSSSWYNKNNWLPKQVPVDTNNVKILLSAINPLTISSGTAKCKNMVIENGASLNMTGGNIEVYGKMSATNAFAFSLSGGTMKLFHGSNFPEDMHFNNLTITSLNNTLEDNTYSFPGTVVFVGDLVITGSATSTNFRVPNILMNENNQFNLSKNLAINQGQAGTVNTPLADNTTMPAMNFNGVTEQSVLLKNKSPYVDGALMNCNLIINNPLVKLNSPKMDIYMYNLIVNQSLNLAGNSIYTIGKIVYNTANLPLAKIINTKTSQGRISIGNDADYNYDANPHYIHTEKLRYLQFSSYASGLATDTLVVYDPLSVDTLLIDGYLKLNGCNVMVGAASRSTGFVNCTIMGNEYAYGTLSLLGNSGCPRYKLVADKLNHFVLNCPSGVELNNAVILDNTHPAYGKMKLFGNARLINGNFDMKGSEIVLVKDDYINTVNLGKLTEAANQTFICSDNQVSSFITIDTTVSTTLNSANFGGLGFFITCNNPIGKISIRRSPLTTQGINGGNSINRVYSISNQGAPSGLNARIKIKYDDSELQGVNESDLAIFRRDAAEPQGIWHLVPSSVNTATKLVTATSGLSEIDFSNGGLTFYTLGSANTPLRKATTLPLETASGNATKVTAYPNPFSYALSANLISKVNEEGTLQVTDISGRIVHTSAAVLKEGENTLTICCMEHADDGIYFLQIHTATQNNVIRIVKNK